MADLFWLKLYILDDEFVNSASIRLIFFQSVWDISQLLPFFYMFTLESCGTVPNPEKSRLSRPVGQTGLSRKLFGTGQTGSGQFENFRDGTNGIGTIQKKTNVPNFAVSVPKCVGFRFLFITNMFVFKWATGKKSKRNVGRCI